MSLKPFTRFPAHWLVLLLVAVAASSGCRGAALGRLFTGAGVKTAGTVTRFKPVTLPRVNVPPRFAVPPAQGITALPPAGGIPVGGAAKLPGQAGGPVPALGAVGRESVSSGSTPIIIPSGILRDPNRDRDEDRKQPAAPPRLP
jgi:hypothetical protein